MKDHREFQLAAQATGRAIQAIEHQTLVRSRSESPESAAKRNEFFALLDTIGSDCSPRSKRRSNATSAFSIPLRFPALRLAVTRFSTSASAPTATTCSMHGAKDLKHVFHAEPGGGIRR